MLLLVLCAPLPWGFRKNVSRFIFQFRAYERFQAVMNYITFGLCLAVLESLNALRSVYRKIADADLTPAPEESSKQSDNVSAGLAHDDFTMNEGHLRWQKVRAERNVYLATFAITAMFAITRLIRLTSVEIYLRDKVKELNGGKEIPEMRDVVDQIEKKKS